MTPYIQHEPTNMKGRGGVTAITVYMTNEEKLRLVQSVYSNPKRLRIAQFILANPYCTNEEISDVLEIEKTSVSKMVGEMLAVGVVEIITKDKDRRSNHLRLTELGKKLLKL